MPPKSEQKHLPKPKSSDDRPGKDRGQDPYLHELFPDHQKMLAFVGYNWYDYGGRALMREEVNGVLINYEDRKIPLLDDMFDLFENREDEFTTRIEALCRRDKQALKNEFHSLFSAHLGRNEAAQDRVELLRGLTERLKKPKYLSENWWPKWVGAEIRSDLFYPLYAIDSWCRGPDGRRVNTKLIARWSIFQGAQSTGSIMSYLADADHKLAIEMAELIQPHKQFFASQLRKLLDRGSAPGKSFSSIQIVIPGGPQSIDLAGTTAGIGALTVGTNPPSLQQPIHRQPSRQTLAHKTLSSTGGESGEKQTQTKKGQGPLFHHSIFDSRSPTSSVGSGEKESEGKKDDGSKNKSQGGKDKGVKKPSDKGKQRERSRSRSRSPPAGDRRKRRETGKEYRQRLGLPEYEP